MNEINSWWEICKIGGAGASVVLGPVCLLLWRAFQSEIAYSKGRDKETITILNALTNVIKDDGLSASRSEEKVLSAIGAAEKNILAHMEKRS